MFSPMARTTSRPVARSLVKSDPPGELQGPLRTRLRVYLYGNGGRGVAGDAYLRRRALTFGGGRPPPAKGVETSQSVSARRSQAFNVGTSLGGHTLAVLPPFRGTPHPISAVAGVRGLGRETSRRRRPASAVLK